jgi:hypothetical protein
MIALPFIFWLAFGLFVGVHTYLSMLSHHHQLPRLLLYHVLVALFWAVAAAPVAALARRWTLVPFRWTSLALHALVASAASLLYIAWFTGLEVLVSPYDILGIQTFVPGYVDYFFSKFPIGVLIYAGTVGAVLAYAFHERSRDREIRAARLEGELAHARLDALASQLQPHFLFNTLHTVSGLMRAGESQAAVATLADLSDLLRYALDSRGGPDTPLEEEMAAVRAYLAIQQLRSGDDLSITVDVDRATHTALVPRLLLQPLVENALRHGRRASSRPWLLLRAARSGNELTLAVENGVDAGASEDARGLGIGLEGTAARLAQLHGSSARLHTHRSEEAFSVTIALPWREHVPAETVDA